MCSSLFSDSSAFLREKVVRIIELDITVMEAEVVRLGGILEVFHGRAFSERKAHDPD